MIKTITNRLFLLVTMLLLSTVNALAQNVSVAQIGDDQYASLADAIAAVPTDGTKTTIKMLADETLAEGATLTIATGKNIVLNLNGNTISGSSSVTNASFYFITNSGSLEITDNSANEDGKISYQAVKYDGGYSKEYVTIYNFRGTLTLTKGMVENLTGGGLAYAINNSSNAWGTASSTFNMNGGKISAPKGDAALRVYQNCSASSAYSKNYVNITGGTIVDTGIFIDEFLYKNNIPANYTGDNIETIINISGGTINGLIDMKIRHPFNTLLNITDGTFTNTALRAYKYTPEYVEACGEPTEPLVNISGGNLTFASGRTFEVTNANVANSVWAEDYKPFALTGGTFSVNPSAYVAEGYVAVDNKNGTWTVKKATAKVAKIGKTEYASLEEAFAAAEDGQTIKLIADCELTEVLTNTKNVTLDLGTFAIYGTVEDFMIQNKGTLEINADENNPGKIYNTVFAKRRGPVCNLAEGNITINGGIFGDNDADPTNVSTVNGGWGFFNLGTATINGGIFTTGDPDYSSNPTVWAYAINNGDDGETSTAHLTINGGKVYGKHGDIANDSGTMIINDVTTFGTAQFYNIYCERGDVTVNGGTFVKQAGKTNFHVYADATATVTVKGGTFTKNTINSTFAGGNGTVALMGGTYNKQPEAKFVAAGYEAVDNNNGTWTVSPAAVAQIGSVKYATLEAAFAAAQDGQTIKLLANCSGNGIIAPQGKFATGLTVDFGGFTYTVDGSTLAGSAGTKTQAFQLLKDNKITFTNGAIVGNTADVKMLIQNYSDLTLSYMTLDATQGTNSVNYVLSTNNGNTVINHTTITAKDNGKAFDVDSGWGNYESNSVELMGQSVINGDIEVAFEGKTAGEPSVLKLTVGTLNGKIVMGTGADKCTVIKGTYFAAEAPEGYEWKYNDADTRILKAIEYINDVTDGETVVATETATITNGEATITNVEIAQEGVKNVTVSAAINSADVTEIAEGAFASLAESAVQTIDLSSTKVALEGERSVNPVLKDIPATALVYLPSTSSKVSGTNVVIKDAEKEEYTCNDFQMLDEKDYSVPTPFTATTATLSRSFTAGLHCTVCLPYDVPAANINGSIYRYTGFDSTVPAIEMTIDEDGLDANVPYIFVPSGNSGSISTSGTIQVSMSDAPQESVSGSNFTFKGVFEEKHFTEEEYVAGIYGYAGENKFNFSQGAFYKLGINAYVPATRAYLVSNSAISAAPSINGAQAAPALPSKIKVILKSATGETTDILHFDMETAEDDAPVYNLNGQRVNHAEKGIYIKNGKKVIIK